MYRHRFTDFTDALIPVYNWGFEVLGRRKHETFREHVLELTALAGGECLLDAGCGTGMMALRIAAMGLFGATAVKLVVLDIRGLGDIYRVVAFLVVGGLMIGGAFLYARAERQLKQQEQEAEAAAETPGDEEAPG